MSQKNSGDGNRSARERLQQQREREKTREKQRRILIVSAAVVGVLGLAAVVGVIAAGGDKDSASDNAGRVVVPAGATDEDGKPAVPTGKSDAPSTLAIWEDFRCPACAQFENAFRDTIHELEAAGAIRTEYHLATLIDGNMGGSGSLRAANAAACAQDAGKFTAYHDTLYINQPQETDDAFGDNAKLIELAAKVPGLDTPAFRSCVNDGTHDTWVAKSNEAFRNGGFGGTPSVLLNGESVFPQKGSEQISPDNLKKWVAEANKGKKPGTAAPTSAPAPSPGSPSAG
ncbi:MULTISPECIES: DsbA family protein [unclassified Streptomyces]|uniref:DsbA family protein n=1 Tax=unclassified Streptomyces TaxID=2593676 RepID=UPI0036A547E3